MSKKAMKLALEALEPFITPNWAGCGVDKANAAYAALCKALASGASEESSGVAQPDRHELQKDGKHPAPCARFCEAAAFNIEIRGLRKRLTEQPAQPQEPVDKSGSPCPKFWDWLPKAYDFEGLGNFTKYNMEVAFLAGKQSVPASKTWVGLTEDQRETIRDSWRINLHDQVFFEIEAKLKEKNA